MADINYSQIVNRSWAITKKNKWLWLYGTILALFGAGGGGGGNFNFGGSSSFNSDSPSREKAGEEVSKVLGATTTQLTQWFQNIPVSTWILLALGLVFFIVLGLLISWVVRSWAQASLISALFEAENKDITSLTQSSKFGLSKTKSFMLFSLVSAGVSLLFIITTLSVAGIGVLVFSFSSLLRNIWLFVCIFAGSLSFIFAILLFIMTDAYAKRLMVLKNLAPWESWKKAFALSKKHFLSGFLMGVINTGLGCAVGCLGIVTLAVVVGIPAGIILIPTIMASSDAKTFVMPNVYQIGALVLVFLMYIYLQYLLSGIFLVFKTSTWNLLIQELLKEEQKT